MPQLQKPKPEDINNAYRDGYITAAQKNGKMRQLASDNLEDMVANWEIPQAYWKQMVKHGQENWDALVKIATQSDPSKSSMGNLSNIAMAMWYQAAMLSAPFTAFGEVNGKMAKVAALKAGASEGWAKVIETTVDVGSGFLPIGQGARLFAKGVQATAPKIAADLEKVTGAVTGTKPVQLTAEMAKEAEAEKVIRKAMGEALQADGVKIAGAAEASTFVGPPTAKEQFLKSLQGFEREMAKVTERKAHSVTLAEAEKLGIGIEDLRTLLGAQGLNESQMAAYLKALENPIKEWVDTARRVVGGDKDALAQFRQQSQDIFSYIPKFRQAEVTAGRTVEILKEQPPAKAITEMMTGWDAESMAKLDLDGATRNMAEDILSLANEPGKLTLLQLQGSQAIQQGLDWWGMGKEAWRNLLLARPITWTRTFLGNLLATTSRSIERETAGWLSVDDRAGVMRGEGLQAFYGQMASLGEAFHAFGSALRKTEEVSRFDEQLNKIPGAVGRLVNTPTGIVGGMDAMFKVVARTSDYYALAYRDGKRAAEDLGLQGKAYVDYLADYMARRRIAPTSEMRQHAETVAVDDTFQSELGKMGKAAQTFLQTGPMYYWFTFFKSGLNLIKWSLERTPGIQFLGKSLYKDILAGGEAADMAVARLTLGTMAGQFLYGLHQAGMATSGGPTEGTLRRAWMSDKRPYSFYNDHTGVWYPFKNVAEPGTTIPEIVFDLAEIHNQLDDPTAEQSTMAVGITLTKDVLDNTWWKTFGDIADFLGSLQAGERVSDKASKLLAAPLVSLLTGGPFFQGIQRSNDPVLREAKTALDQVKNGFFGQIFGYGDNPKPVRDGYGDPVLIPQAIGAKWLRETIPFGGGVLAGALNLSSPFTEVTQADDRVKKEGDMLRAKLPPFPWSTGGGAERDSFDIRAALPGEAIPVPLTVDQRDRWQVIYRNILRDKTNGIEAQLLDTPDYQNAPWALKREMFMKYLSSAREGAKGMLLTEDVPLAKATATSTAGRYLPMINPEDRPAVQQNLNESLDLLDNMLPKERDNLMRWGFMGSGEERDQEIIHGVKAEISKPISELNAAAAATPR